MKKSDLVLIVSIGIIALCLVLSLFKSNVVIQQGYTPNEVEYLLKIQQLTNDKNRLSYEIEKFKESIIKDSVFVSTASNEQIDSLFTNYFK